MGNSEITQKFRRQFEKELYFTASNIFCPFNVRRNVPRDPWNIVGIEEGKTNG